MARIPLFQFNSSLYFSKDAIGYRNKDTHQNWFTLLHGQSEYNNGDNKLPGAFDTRAEESKVELPRPLLTGSDRQPNKHGWCVGDIGIITSSCFSVAKKGAIIQFIEDDGSSCPYWHQIHGETTLFTHTRFALFYSAIDRIPHPEYLDMSNTSIFRPGAYIRCENMTPTDPAFIAFAQGCMSNGAKKLEYGTYKPQDFTYFGWKPDSGLYFYDGEGAFGPDRQRITTDQIITPEASTMRNPFQEGDRVVATGFKNERNPGSGEHYFGTNETMERWVRCQIVLTVTQTGRPNDPLCVRASDGNVSYNFHASELRLVTQAEIGTVEAKPPIPERGSIIRMNDKVYMVISQRPDRDGDMGIAPVGNGTSTFLRVTGSRVDTYEILGRIMDDGDFRPATATGTKRPISELKAGDKVRCITRAPFMTVGNIYTLQRDGVDVDGDIAVRDNDGDLTHVNVTKFEAV